MTNDHLAGLQEMFHITLEDREGALFSMTAEDLLDQENAKHFLRIYASCIKSPELQPAAAYFGGWFGFVAFALQYMLSVENKRIDLSLSNITVQLYPKGQYFPLSFKINRWSERVLPASETERTRSRYQALADFYGKTVRPLFEAVSAAAEIHVGQLWGQLPARFYYFKNNLLDNMEDAGLRTRITDDYNALVHELEPTVFGTKKNPFNIKLRMVEDIRDPQKQVPLKSACCLYYKTEGGEYCYTCPRLKEEKRQAMRDKFREKT